LLVADEGMYRISVLKHEPKDFSYGELRQEVGWRKFLVQFYTVYKLRRMPLPTTRLYLLCFAYHRFRQINDNLIDAFIHLVDQYEQQAKIAAETANTTDIQPQRHSTDTHGTNQVNFFLLYTFGYQFAPRYRDLHKKMDGLVGFHHPSHYAGHLIKPSRKILDALIVKEWPNIQRIVASLAQKDMTQATIVRKLSSYARQNQTKKA
jgi:hypothetical protein